MKRKGVPALFLTLGMMVIYLAAFAAQAGAFQPLPDMADPPSSPQDPAEQSGTGNQPQSGSEPGGSIGSGETDAGSVADAGSEAGAQSMAWTPLPVANDPLLRLPGTQPDQGVVLDALRHSSPVTTRRSVS